MRAFRSFFSMPVLAGLVALFIAAWSSPAKAIQVVYSTTGVFASSGTSVSSAGDATISFTGTTEDVIEPTFAPLGYLEAAAGVGGSFNDTLTIFIHQTVPGTDTGTLVGVVQGTVTFSSSLAQLIITPGTSVTITAGSYAVTYTPYGSTFIPAPSSSTSVPIMASITAQAVSAHAVPLPAAAWGGMALIAFLAVNKLRLQRRDAL